MLFCQGKSGSIFLGQRLCLYTNYTTLDRILLSEGWNGGVQKSCHSRQVPGDPGRGILVPERKAWTR